MGPGPESRQPAPPPRGALGSTARAQSRKAPRQENLRPWRPLLEIIPRGNTPGVVTTKALLLL